MNYGYLRMSTGKQDGEGQRDTIRKYCTDNGVRIDRWIEETVSSREKRSDRQVAAMIDGLKPGDTVVVSELSRLARSMAELLAIVQDARDKGASIAIAESGKTLSPEDDWQADLYLMGMSVAASIERDMLSQRTKAALAARKAQGVKLGRPKGTSKLKDQDSEIQKYLDMGITKANIAKLLGVSRSTLYDYLREREQQSQKAKGR